MRKFAPMPEGPAPARQAPGAQDAEENRISKSRVPKKRKKCPGRGHFVVALLRPELIGLRGSEQAQRFFGNRSEGNGFERVTPAPFAARRSARDRAEEHRDSVVMMGDGVTKRADEPLFMPCGEVFGRGELPESRHQGFFSGALSHKHRALPFDQSQTHTDPESCRFTSFHRKLELAASSA